MPGPSHPKQKPQDESKAMLAPPPEIDLKRAHTELQNLFPQAVAQARTLKTHGDAFYVLCEAVEDGESIEGFHPLLRNLLHSLISNDQINDHLLGSTASKMTEAWKNLHTLTSKAVLLCDALEQSKPALDNEAILKSL